MPIVDFRCKDTRALYERRRVRQFGSFEAVARRKLAMLDAAVVLRDLATPAGNHLEALKDDRAGQHSIRINDQYRICFEWSDDGPRNVEIVDYH